MPTSDDIAREIYNRVLGNKPGRTPRVKTSTQHTSNPIANAVLNKILSDAVAATKKSSGGKSSYGYKPLKPSKLTEEQKDARSQQLLKKAGQTKKKSPNFLGQLGNVVNTTLDVIATPGRVLSGAAMRGSQAINQGEAPWSILDDMLYGAKRNLFWQDKNYFYDALKETPAGEAIEKMPGGWQKSATRFGAGLAGDIALDPLTYFSLGTSTAAKLNKAEKAAEEVAKLGKVGRAVKKLKPGIRPGEGAGKEGILNRLGEIVGEEVDIATEYPRQLGINRPVIKEAITKDIQDKGREIITEVAGGARKNKIIGADAITTGNLTTDAAFQIQNSYFDTLKPALKEYKAKKLDRTREVVVAKYPILQEFEKAKAVAASQGAQDVEKVATNIIRKRLNDEAASTAARMSKKLEESLVTRPTIKFAGKEIAQLPINLRKASKLLDDSIITKLTKGFSHEQQFPGATARVAQVARSKVSKQFNEIQRELGDIAKGLSKSERKLLDSQTALSGPLRVKQQRMEALYKRLYDMEDELGMRAGETFDPAYRYTRIKSKGGHTKDAKEIAKFRRDQQTAIRIASKKLATESDAEARARLFEDIVVRKRSITPEALKSQAIKSETHIEEDAIRNFMAKASRTSHKVQNETFRQDLARMFGIEGYLEEASTAGMRDAEILTAGLANKGLEDVSFLGKKGGFFEPKNIEIGGAKINQKLFLDTQLRDVFKNFEKIAGYRADDNIRPAVEMFDKFMGHWKRMQTIYSPFAFNIKNSISDAIFGMMDDIGPRDYVRFMRSAGDDVVKILNGKGTNKLIKFRNGESYRLDELWNVYAENLGQGGLIHSDVPVNVSKLNVPQKLKAISEGREDFGRFIHFIGSMEDELMSGKAMQEAIPGAMYRVNKFKFDYGALTAAETGVKRLAPFYTFPRKAIPAAAQSLATHPRTISTLHKIYKNEPESTPGLESFMFPSFLKEQGVASFGQGKNPWALTAAGTPIETLRQPSTALSMLGPIPSLGLELATGRSTFTGRPIDTASLSGIRKVIQDKFTPRAYREFQSVADSGARPLAQTVLSGLTGQKLYQVSDKMIASQQAALEAQYDDVLDVVDKKLQLIGYSIFRRKGNETGAIGIRDIATGEIKEYTDPKKAIEVAKHLLSGD